MCLAATRTGAFRVNYGHGTGNDYLAGNGRGVPASFQSRDLYATIGHRIDSEKRIDFSYIRLDQTDVEYPALVYDVNFLVTDGFELEFTDTGSRFGELAAEAWYNRTRFEGDSNRPGKLKQLPDLATEFSSPRLATDVDGSSLGYRLAVTRDWNAHTVGFGTDLSYLDQTLNDRETAGPNSGNNFPIPHSNSVDVGLFADMQSNLASRVNANAGARIDHASYRSSRIVPGTPLPIDLLKQAELDREFELWSAYLSIDYLCTDRLTLTVAGGAGQRAPTFTELYAVQSFIGTLQRGLTFVNGDPELRKEQLRQIDLIANWRSDRIRFRATGYYAWIEDYITYDLTIPTVRRGGLSTGVAFVNTDLATLSGFELDGSWDVNRRVDIFANMSFVEGRDHTRNKPSRQGGLTRSGSFLREEPLPGIPPFEANLGMRLSDPTPDRLWNVEFLGRFVDRQDRIAQTLLEKPTRGFVTGDIRSFWRLTDRLDFFVGIENVADRKYLEHLDYRAGKGLLRRGRSWNFGIDFRL